MTKEEYIRKAMMLKPTAKEWRRLVNKAVNSGCIDYASAFNFGGIYPLAVAILEDRYLEWYLRGSVVEETRRYVRREANNIKRFL